MLFLVVFFVLLDGKNLRRAGFTCAHIGGTNETGRRGALNVHPDHGGDSKTASGSINDLSEARRVLLGS